MSKKEQCKLIMRRFFGPAAAAMVDSLTEEEAVPKCRQKVAAMLGPEKAKAFDYLEGGAK